MMIDIYHSFKTNIYVLNSFIHQAITLTWLHLVGLLYTIFTNLVSVLACYHVGIANKYS